MRTRSSRISCILLATCAIGVHVVVIAACAAPQRTSTSTREASGSSAEHRQRITKSRNCFAGLPKSTDPTGEFAFLKNDGYDIGYSDQRKNPLWAAYTLRGDQDWHSVKRPKSKRFSADKRVSSGVSHNDYTNSGFDRGHLAPSDAIGKWFGSAAQNGTFTVTNICPQKHKLNDEVWGGLEAAEVYIYGRQFDQIWVLCGPIFGDHPDHIGPDKDIEVPEAFFKIIVQNDDDRPRALSVIMSQSAAGTQHKLSDFSQHVTVREIEQKTHLNFFSELPDEVENAVELGEADADVWGTATLILNDNAIRNENDGE